MINSIIERLINIGLNNLIIVYGDRNFVVN